MIINKCTVNMEEMTVSLSDWRTHGKPVRSENPCWDHFGVVLDDINPKNIVKFEIGRCQRICR